MDNLWVQKGKKKGMKLKSGSTKEKLITR